VSTSIDQAFIKQYERDVHQAFQRQGSQMLNTVRTKMDVVGASTTFQKVGKGTATTKSRHGIVTPMNQAHTPVECTISDFYAGDYVDKLDEAKTNIDERMVIANGGAYALGRKVDEQIITVADGTSTTGSITVTSSAAIRNGLLTMVQKLWSNDVPNDGQVYCFITPLLWAMAMTVKEFASTDYVTDRPFMMGPMVKRWNGALWSMHTGLPGVGTNEAKNFGWHKTAIGYAANGFGGNVAATGGKSGVGADIWWNGERVAHFVNHSMAGGAALIDATGVVEMTHDDNEAIPVS
jgi:hypothetical protein